LQLSIARNAGNMKGFHFGNRKRTARRLVGEYAIHIQCPWRMQYDGRIITGSADYYTRADDNDDPDWEPGTISGHLQNQILGRILQGFDAETRSHINETEYLFVTAVDADTFGGAEIHMTGGYDLVLFPCASRGEEWRLIQPGSDAPHFVVEAGAASLE